MRVKQLTLFAIGAGAAGLLAGCVDVQKPLLADHGFALRAAAAAQIADPEPHYARKIEPASSGARAVLAQQRYNKDEVKQPVLQSTSSIGGGAGGGGSSGGAGGNR